MAKTYYMIATKKPSKDTKIRGITNKLKKANLLYFKLIDENTGKFNPPFIKMYRLTCDAENGEISHKECVRWYKPEQSQAN